jgi:hypothetical protein
MRYLVLFLTFVLLPLAFLFAELPTETSMPLSKPVKHRNWTPQLHVQQDATGLMDLHTTAIMLLLLSKERCRIVTDFAITVEFFIQTAAKAGERWPEMT